MNIKVPTILEKDIKSEEEAMVIAFLLMVSEDHGFGTYNFNSHDVRKLFGNTTGNSLNNDSPKLENLRTMVNIAAIDRFNWCLSFKNYNPKTWRQVRGAKAVRKSNWAINKTRNIGLWCFAMGRYTHPDIVFENHNPFYYKDDFSTVKEKHWNNFKPTTI